MEMIRRTFSGIASGSHFVGDMFTKATGIKRTRVPFQGGNPALLAALGGCVSCTLSTAGQMGTHIRPSINAKALILFDDKHSPHLPDLPTAWACWNLKVRWATLSRIG